MKLLLCLVLAACGIAVFWLYAFESDSGPGAATRAAPTQPRTAGETESTLQRPDASDPSAAAERVQIATEAKIERLDESSTVLAEPAFAVIRAHVVDSTQAPLSGAWLSSPLMTDSDAQADSSGIIRAEFLPSDLEWLAERMHERQLTFTVGAPGHCVQTLHLKLVADQFSFDLGTVELELGGTVHGRVSDEFGVGIDGALVLFGVPHEGEPDDIRLARSGPRELFGRGSSRPSIRVHSEAGGNFLIDGVPAGFGTIWARADKSLWSYTEPVGVRQGEEVFGIELVVRSSPGDVISGTVLDPDGRPLSAIPLTFRSGESSAWMNGFTDRRGEFFVVPTDGMAQTITAYSTHWEWEHQIVEAVQPGTHDLVIQFVRAGWLNVSVRDRKDGPIINGRVRGYPAEDTPTRSSDRQLERCESPLDEFGHARLRRPKTMFNIRVDAPGYRDLSLGPYDPATFPDPLYVNLEELPALVGQVFLASGEPAARAKVSLHMGSIVPSAKAKKRTQNKAPRPHYSHRGWPGDGEAFVYALQVSPKTTVTADGEGKFRLPIPDVDYRENHGSKTESINQTLSLLGYVDDPAPKPKPKPAPASPKSNPQTWYVSAIVSGNASITVGPMPLDIDEGNIEVELHCPPAGSLAGNLILEDGSSPQGWTIVASDGLAEIVKAKVARDGSFNFKNLHPGGWQVRAFEPGREINKHFRGYTSDREIEPDVTIKADRETRYEHVSSKSENATVQGRLLLDGKPPGAWKVALTGTRGSQRNRQESILDPDGQFNFKFEANVKAGLYFHTFDKDHSISISTFLDIIPGSNSWFLDLKTASIRGKLNESDSTKGWLGGPTFVVNDAGVTIRTILASEDGNFGPSVVASGLGQLFGTKKTFGSEPPLLLELDLKPGETRVVEIE